MKALCVQANLKKRTKRQKNKNKIQLSQGFITETTSSVKNERKRVKNNRSKVFVSLLFLLLCLEIVEDDHFMKTRNSWMLNLFWMHLLFFANYITRTLVRVNSKPGMLVLQILYVYRSCISLFKKK